MAQNLGVANQSLIQLENGEGGIWRIWSAFGAKIETLCDGVEEF